MSTSLTKRPATQVREAGSGREAGRAHEANGVDARQLGTILIDRTSNPTGRASMNVRNPSGLPAEPPPTVAEALRNRLSGWELEAFAAVFAVRTTAQQMSNAITEWMADSAGSSA